VNEENVVTIGETVRQRIPVSFVTICDSQRGERNGTRSGSEATSKIGEAGGRAAQRFSNEREGSRACARAVKVVEGCGLIWKIYDQIYDQEGEGQQNETLQSAGS
jgi:hypothetical protein